MLLELWQAGRGGGFGGGPLPFSGGAAEQPSCVMAAFDIMSDAAARLKPQK